MEITINKKNTASEQSLILTIQDEIFQILRYTIIIDQLINKSFLQI